MYDIYASKNEFGFSIINSMGIYVSCGSHFIIMSLTKVRSHVWFLLFGAHFCNLIRQLTEAPNYIVLWNKLSKTWGYLWIFMTNSQVVKLIRLVSLSTKLAWSGFTHFGIHSFMPIKYLRLCVVTTQGLWYLYLISLYGSLSLSSQKLSKLTSSCV